MTLSFRSSYKLCDHLCFCHAREQTQSLIHSSRGPRPAWATATAPPEALLWLPLVRGSTCSDFWPCMPAFNIIFQVSTLAFPPRRPFWKPEGAVFPHTLLLPCPAPSGAFPLIPRAKSFLHLPSHLPGSREGQWWVDLSCHPLVFASCRPRALVVALSWSED